MKTRKHDTHWMVGVAMMAAIVVLLANTPLGMIQLPIIKATTTHIPVILGAILMGPLAGTIMVKTAGKKLAAKADRTPDEADMLDMMFHGAHRVREENLAAVLAWYQSLS